MNFIFKKRGHSPETKRLWIERNHLLKPDGTRIVGKGKESERIQEYRPNQASRKRIAEINIKIYNRFFRYCETLETTPLLEYQQNNNESWLQNNQSDGESETSHIKRDKCLTNALKKFKKHETVNLIRLKQTAIKNTQQRSKARHRRSHQKSGKGFRARYSTACRRNSTRYKNAQCNRGHRKPTTG